jgi:hypothetical protein
MEATAHPRKLLAEEIEAVVQDVLATTPFVDIHTHLFPPQFGKLGLWGIDELLTYHYLEAEYFRSTRAAPEEYWKLSKIEKAEKIWQALFVERSPISEATRGVLAVLQAFGLPTGDTALAEAHSFFRAQSLATHMPKVLQLAGINTVVMTNDPLDPEEALLWRNGKCSDPRFFAALRLDRILCGWSTHWQKLADQGYRVDESLSGDSIDEIRRFLADWYQRMHPLYMAVSLSDDFRSPEESLCDKILRAAVLPSCREFKLPMSLMIGVRRQINPAIGLAGDGVGRSNLRALENLCRDFPDNRFLVSVLSRENQHELCVYARKFQNLMPFGCWWFLNNMSIVEEISRERMEMLGTSFIPQHSDARVLEQMIYKWRNTRLVFGRVLADSYRLMTQDGRAATRDLIQRDVNRFFRGNFEEWTGQSLATPAPAGTP